MQTLIKPQAKLKIAIFDNSTYQVEKKVINSKIDSSYKLYQKLIAILLTSSILLIFPESPKDSEALCQKYHSIEACLIL